MRVRVEVTAPVRQLERAIATRLVVRVRQSVVARLRNDEDLAVRDGIDADAGGPGGRARLGG